MNKEIQSLLDSIRDLRMASNTNSEEFINKNALLTSLKATALTKKVDLSELTDIDFLDTVKSRFNATRKAAIKIVSKSDEDEIGTKIAYVKKEEEKEDVIVTYDMLTLEEIQTVFTVSPYLQTLLNEMYFLINLLPKQLTETEIRQIISDNSLKSIREVMPYFRQFYPGRVDNKLLSTISKSL